MVTGFFGTCILLMLAATTLATNYSTPTRLRRDIEDEEGESRFGRQVLPVGKATTVALAGKQLFYYGGAMLETIEVFPIFYGANVAYKNELMQYYKAITDSPYLDWLTEYNAKDNNGDSYAVTRGFVSGSYEERNPPYTYLDQSTIETYLRSLVTRGIIKITANTYFPLHFAAGVTVPGACTVFCAYHTGMYVSGKWLYYGVMPDQGGICAGGCGGDSKTVNNLFSVSSHELIETLTDPLPGYGWMGTSIASEIGDLCNHLQDKVLGNDGNLYTVQLQYSNQQGGCIATKSGSTP
ncbi:hypothetical protein HDU78_011413, partial [Chytriomyces hyalinus]